jgi:hypothetical protein
MKAEAQRIIVTAAAIRGREVFVLVRASVRRGPIGSSFETLTNASCSAAKH